MHHLRCFDLYQLFWGNSELAMYWPATFHHVYTMVHEIVPQFSRVVAWALSPCSKAAMESVLIIQNDALTKHQLKETNFKLVIKCRYILNIWRMSPSPGLHPLEVLLAGRSTNVYLHCLDIIQHRQLNPPLWCPRTARFVQLFLWFIKRHQ